MKKFYLLLTVLITVQFSATAQDQYVGEIRIFAGNFAPSGWAFCNGQILNISQNTALFSLLGTTYGGNGQTTFALPNLQGRVVNGPGQGPGLSPVALGQLRGSDNVTLTAQNLPSHRHAINVSTALGTTNVPVGAILADTKAFDNEYNNTVTTPTESMRTDALSPSGGSQPVSTVQPVLVLNYIIALQGIYPPHP
jgi:microcystin-dependent protein